MSIASVKIFLFCLTFTSFITFIVTVLQSEQYETASQHLFLNLGYKKRLKDSKSKLENAILKSKVEVLGEIFKKHVDRLKDTQNGVVSI